MSGSLHGGVRPFYPKSTYTMNLRALFVAINIYPQHQTLNYRRWSERCGATCTARSKPSTLSTRTSPQPTHRSPAPARSRSLFSSITLSVYRTIARFLRLSSLCLSPSLSRSLAPSLPRSLACSLSVSLSLSLYIYIYIYFSISLSLFPVLCLPIWIFLVLPLSATTHIERDSFSSDQALVLKCSDVTSTKARKQ